MAKSDYYKNMLDSLGIVNSEYPAILKISVVSKSTNFMQLNDESATEIVKWLKENYKVIDSENTQISPDELADHLTKWFGEDWGDQNCTQIYAMVIDLLIKLKIKL